MYKKNFFSKDTEFYIDGKKIYFKRKNTKIKYKHWIKDIAENKYKPINEEEFLKKLNIKKTNKINIKNDIYITIETYIGAHFTFYKIYSEKNNYLKYKIIENKGNYVYGNV